MPEKKERRGLPEMRIRGAVPEDAPYIIDTWVTNSRYDWPVDWPYIWAWKPVVAKLIERSVVTVAVELDAGRIMGYCVQDMHVPVLHWVYVRAEYRGFGMVRKMVKGGASVASHPWPKGERWRKVRRRDEYQQGRTLLTKEPGKLAREMPYKAQVLPACLMSQSQSPSRQPSSS